MKRILSKYRKSIIWNSGLVLFSLLAYLTTHLHKQDLIWYNLLPLYPLGLSVIIILFLVTKSLYLKLITRIQLVDYVKTSYFNVNVLNDQGDIAIRVYTKVNNISSKTINWLPEETIRTNVDSKGPVPIKINSISPNKELEKSYIYNFEEQLSGKTVFATTWRPKVRPGIEQSEEFEYEWSVDNIEKAHAEAFKSQDEFHVRVRQYYLSFSADIIAPTGYKFSSIESSVVDLSGNRLEVETNEMSQPKLNETKNQIKIEQNNPRPLTVYMYRHSLVPENH